MVGVRLVLFCGCCCIFGGWCGFWYLIGGGCWLWFGLLVVLVRLVGDCWRIALVWDLVCCFLFGVAVCLFAAWRGLFVTFVLVWFGLGGFMFI